jgi:acetylornithine aminotransferase
MGDYLITQLKNVPGITAIRGKGLMLGIEMAYPVADMRKNMVFQENVFTGSSSNKNTIRLLPPLNVTKEECDIFITAFKNQAVLHL